MPQSNNLIPQTSPLKPLPSFTIIELLITVSIVAVVATFALVQQRNTSSHARFARLEADKAAVDTALENYYADHRHYPPDLQNLENDGYIDELPEHPETGDYEPDYELGTYDTSDPSDLTCDIGADCGGLDEPPCNCYTFTPSLPTPEPQAESESEDTEIPECETNEDCGTGQMCQDNHCTDLSQCQSPNTCQDSCATHLGETPTNDYCGGGDTCCTPATQTVCQSPNACQTECDRNQGQEPTNDYCSGGDTCCTPTTEPEPEPDPDQVMTDCNSFTGGVCRTQCNTGERTISSTDCSNDNLICCVPR